MNPTAVTRVNWASGYPIIYVLVFSGLVLIATREKLDQSIAGWKPNFEIMEAVTVVVNLEIGLSRDYSANLERFLVLLELDYSMRLRLVDPGASSRLRFQNDGFQH
jgi:hypothetical protein